MKNRLDCLDANIGVTARRQPLAAVGSHRRPWRQGLDEEKETHNSRRMSERSNRRPWQQGLDEEKETHNKWETKRESLAEAVRCQLKVVVRVRPAHSSKQQCVGCEDRIGPWVSINGGPRLEFTTAVLGPASTQLDVYTECAVPLLQAALSGQDSCLFAYGQTGAGKTFSMLGAEGGRCASKLDGIVPRLCAELFRTFSPPSSGCTQYPLDTSAPTACTLPR